MDFLRRFSKTLPTLLTAFVLAVAVWVIAVTSNDPSEKRVYPNAVPLELVGQDTSLIISNDVDQSVTLTLTAPQSIWNQLINEQVMVRAVADLAGLGEGTHVVPVQVQIDASPVKLETQSPRSITVVLERLVSKSLQIEVIEQGDPAVGYQSNNATLSQTIATVSGPQSLVDRVSAIQVLVDRNDAQETIVASATLRAVDVDGNVITGVTLSPSKVDVEEEITQRGGYRNVVVKVIVTGQVASGYRLTNISVSPPAITVFSQNPELVDALPGYIETQPLNLTGAKDDFEIRIPLNLPAGISTVEDASVLVEVGIASIESSVTISNNLIQFVGLGNGMTARASPERVDVIISGPLPLLDQLTAQDVQVVVDLSNATPGTIQVVPQVTISIPELSVESILPGTVEVVVSGPTPRP